MKVGLIDVDGHNYPNFALMKISAFHKNNGDQVEWYNHFNEYDKVYMSKVFTFSPDYNYFINAKEIIKGGTGYDLKIKLPEEIEMVKNIDYSIYPNVNYSIQYFSRGCIRSCSFCLVRQKEGFIKSVSPVELNRKGKWIEVMDNNFFANKEWKNAIEYLLQQNKPVKLFGVDVRILNEEQAKSLNSLKLKGNIHIAWDIPEIDLTEKLKEITSYIKPNKLTCYVLVGNNSSKEQDLFRLRTLKSMGITPFVQPYRDFENKRRPTKYEKDLARWANKVWIFKSCDFFDFEPRNGFKCKNYFNKNLCTN